MALVIPKKDKVNIKDLIEECIKDPSFRFQSNNIEITTSLQSILIHSDDMLISKVISLLIDNTIKYAGSGASMLIESYIEHNKAIIKIHDNGPGIPEAYLENVFDKYKKLSLSKGTNASVGLGLTISREIMKLLRGTITASNSNKYSGVAFTLSFPV